MSQARRYQYRGLPTTDSTGWYVSGRDLVTEGGGILEWCTSERDAQAIREKMSDSQEFENPRVAFDPAVQSATLVRQMAGVVFCTNEPGKRAVGQMTAEQLIPLLQQYHYDVSAALDCLLHGKVVYLEAHKLQVWKDVTPA
jgi:hypothetical protein